MLTRGSCEDEWAIVSPARYAAEEKGRGSGQKTFATTALRTVIAGKGGALLHTATIWRYRGKPSIRTLVSDFFRSASHLFALPCSATPHIMAEEQVTARLDRAGTLQASIYANVIHEKITIVSAGSCLSPTKSTFRDEHMRFSKHA